jgi:hypothetical protein
MRSNPQYLPFYLSTAHQLTKLGHMKTSIITSYRNKTPLFRCLFGLQLLPSISLSSSSSLSMRPRYLYLYISGSSAITMYYKNPNPNIVRSSMHAHVLLFLPVVAFLMHAALPK